MVTVPAATPVTLPVAETVAVPNALLLQVPPPVASVKAILLPLQTDEEDALIAAGEGYTETGEVA